MQILDEGWLRHENQMCAWLDIDAASSHPWVCVVTLMLVDRKNEGREARGQDFGRTSNRAHNTRSHELHKRPAHSMTEASHRYCDEESGLVEPACDFYI
jgi:hypothetical protein